MQCPVIFNPHDNSVMAQQAAVNKGSRGNIRFKIPYNHKFCKVFGMKTTILLDDELYPELVTAAAKRYGNAKSLSRLINDVLKSHFKPKKESMFGALPGISYDGARDKRDRI